MLTLLVLSQLGASLGVPYVPQTDALCGGAAAAMVFRYWGDQHAIAEDFAPFVDRRAGGIADGVLVRAIGDRGWRTARPAGSVEMLEREIERKIPVVILVADRGARYHYLVVTGIDAAHVIVHDPSWGPARRLAVDELVRIWGPTNFWSLIILPRVDSVEPRALTSSTDVASITEPGTACDQLTAAGIDEVRKRGLDVADDVFDRVRRKCPADAGVSREMAGVRFAQRRWQEASSLAEQALAKNPSDGYAWDVLGSSRFVQDDIDGALEAWNHIGKPRVDAVQIDGLRHARYQTVTGVLGLTPGSLLTADAFRLAQRRLENLPDRTASKASYRPATDGFAQVDVAIVEHAARPRGGFEWTAAGIRSAIDREVRVDAPGFTGQGELWSGSWRWWSDRPRVALAFATPHVGDLPGVWRVDASWDSQAYAFGNSSAATTRETRLHGGLAVTDWLTSRVRYSLNSGFDSWNTTRRAVSLGGSLEGRWLDDRLTTMARATAWAPINGQRGFQDVGVRVGLRSSRTVEGWTHRADVYADRVSEAAPYALWPGAGNGQAREALLRAHALLTGGTIDAREQEGPSGAVFGRTLVGGTAETTRWIASRSPFRMAVAGFVDAARASRGAGPVADPVFQVDVGVGFRIKVPGTPGVLRIDAAHGLRDGANGFSLGWQF